MGDTTTHKEIAEKIMDVLKQQRPDEEMYYFELGNWLTDISQMRDPTAMVGAKKTVLQKKAGLFTAEIAELGLHIEEYLDDLMGLPGPQGGLLAAWLREICCVVGIEKFRKAGIDPDRFQDIYDRHFTQYYPHEHVDFPPWPRHDIIGERVPSTWNRHQCGEKPTPGTGRNIYQYTEEQLVYISDLLTVVEQDWAKQPVTPDTVESRQEVLTRFGHVSHALEDFFFHSNFIERAWAESGSDLPQITDDGGGDDDDDDEEESGPRDPGREKRRYMRRMRSPVGKGDDLDKETSKPMDQVYTGFFGGNDVFHTLVDGMKGIVHKELPAPADEILKDILNKHDESMTPEQRQKKRDEELANHKRRLMSDEYVQLAREAQKWGYLHEKSVAAIERLCEMDKNLWKKYESSFLGKKIDMGISGFVKTLVEMAVDEAQRSKKVWTKLDADGVTSDERSDNDASNECIGSHSLMAKDSIRKHPLRQQAFNTACAIGVYTAMRMVQDRQTRLPVARSVPEQPAAEDGGASNTAALRDIDWLHLVQHFVCHPTEAEQWLDQQWWTWLMDGPDPLNTGHTLQYATSAEVAERVQEKKKKELEDKYDQLAVDAEKEWKSFRGQAIAMFVGEAVVAGAVVGAAIGALVGLAAGGPAGAAVGALVGAVVGAAVGLVGALIGAFL